MQDGGPSPPLPCKNYFSRLGYDIVNKQVLSRGGAWSGRSDTARNYFLRIGCIRPPRPDN